MLSFFAVYRLYPRAFARASKISMIYYSSLNYFNARPSHSQKRQRGYINYFTYVIIITIILYHEHRRQFSTAPVLDRSKFQTENFIHEIGKSCRRRRALETDDMSGYRYI